MRKYSEYPIEKIGIPWGDNTISALLHLVPDKKKAPCILYIPGMDQNKEAFPSTDGNPAVNPNPFIKNSTEYPSACWRDESGSTKGEAKVLGLKGQILV